MIYRKRGSRKKEDRIKAARWLGHRRLFLGRRNHVCLPEFAPQVTLQVIDEEGKYDEEFAGMIDKKPVPGEAFVFGPHLLVGTEAGPQIMSEGDFLAQLQDGSIVVYPSGQFRSAYTRMT